MARPSLDRNVKFKTLIRTLDIPRPCVRGLLETMWDVANECGNQVLGSPADVEAAAEWYGAPGDFFAALRDCRLIDELPDGRWQIHDYWDHAPEYVKGRMRKERERKRKAGSPDPADKVTASDPARDGDSGNVTRQSRDGHGTVTQKSDTPAPAPAPSSLFAADAAGGGSTAEEPDTAHPAGTGKPGRKPRKRDDLFDAIAEVTASDPRASGSYIGRLCSNLRSADPPYTPAEVRSLPGILQPRGFSLPLTLGTVEKYVGWTRQPGAPSGESDAEREARMAREREDFERLRREVEAGGGPRAVRDLFGRKRGDGCTPGTGTGADF